MQKEALRVPTLVLMEVYRKIKSNASEDLALEAMAYLSRHEVLDMNREVALAAADLCLEHRLPMADGIVLAHAEILEDRLLTLDNDFSGIPRALILRR
jgi:predicted nucleic acid-binding protein